MYGDVKGSLGNCLNNNPEKLNSCHIELTETLRDNLRLKPTVMIIIIMMMMMMMIIYNNNNNNNNNNNDDDADDDNL